MAERDGALEVRGAPLVGHVGQLGQQQGVVAVVVLRRARPPCGQHARHAVEGVDAEPAVVGERWEPGRLQARARLQQGVALERRLVLDRLVVPGDVVDAEDLDAGSVLAQDPLHLLDLLAVARGEEDTGAHDPSASC
jgi:hypothetical protein